MLKNQTLESFSLKAAQNKHPRSTKQDCSIGVALTLQKPEEAVKLNQNFFCLYLHKDRKGVPKRTKLYKENNVK